MSRARSRRCAAARATTSRSRGTTTSCVAAVQTQLELRRALRRSRRLQEENIAAAAARSADVHRRGAGDEAPCARRSSASRASDATVLITGEHGTGKEVVASLLHRLSARASKPLVTMNAGGLSEGVAESELFGHVKGAFTDARTDRIGCFELADEGTLFLDEIANMPIRLQPKLLRVLQTGEVQNVGSSRVTYVNVRVISATNADLRGRDRRGPFSRRPALPAEHRRHSPAAAARAARGHRSARRALSGAVTARSTGAPVDGFDRSARQALETHLWPGNVRELAHAVERAVLMADDRRDHGRRSRPAGRRPRRACGRRDDARAGREALHPEGAGAPRRRRAQGRRAARREPQRALPAAAAVRAL